MSDDTVVEPQLNAWYVVVVWDDERDRVRVEYDRETIDRYTVVGLLTEALEIARFPQDYEDDEDEEAPDE